MGRVALYGRDLSRDNYGKMVGINLGYNFCCEHEGDISQLAYNINRYAAMSNGKTIKNRSKLKKSNKLLQRWDNTPYKGKVLFSLTPYLRKEIIIDNTQIQSKYSTFILDNDEYTLLILGRVDNDSWHRRFGNRRKFSEEELLSMSEYQGHRNNMQGEFGGNTLGSGTLGNGSFVGSWQYNGDNILILEKRLKEYAFSTTVGVVDSIINTLESGNLGLSCDERRLFKTRGLQLVDLEVAYLTGRKQ